MTLADTHLTKVIIFLLLYYFLYKHGHALGNTECALNKLLWIHIYQCIKKIANCFPTFKSL